MPHGLTAQGGVRVAWKFVYSQYGCQFEKKYSFSKISYLGLKELKLGSSNLILHNTT